MLEYLHLMGQVVTYHFYTSTRREALLVTKQLKHDREEKVIDYTKLIMKYVESSSKNFWAVTIDCEETAGECTRLDSFFDKKVGYYKYYDGWDRDIKLLPGEVPEELFNKK